MKSAKETVFKLRPVSRALRNTFKNKVAGTLLAAATVFTTSAALADGTVTGRISNSRTGQSLEGAIVEIVELGRRDSTSETGEYVLRGVPNGNYTLSVDYFGLEPKKVQVRVTDGVVQLPVELIPLVQEEITVQATRLEGQLRAINQQRTAQGVKTIISEELFGQVNDGNIGNALQKLPGLSVDTDGFSEIPRYVNIRGVSTAYNSVQVDGQRLASSGNGRGEAYGDTGRGFALDDLPSAAINQVEIVKSPTPDMEHDGLGGAVNLRTRTALDYGGQRFDFKVGMNHNALRDEAFPDLSGTYSNIFDLSGGQRLGVSITLQYNETNEGFDNRDEDYFPLRPEDAVNQGLAIAPIGGGGDQPQATATSITGSPGPGLAAALDGVVGERGFVSNPTRPKEALYYHEDTEYNTYVIERERWGLSASFDLELDDSTTMYFRPIYSKEDRFEDDIRYHKIMDNDHNDLCPEAFDEAAVNAALVAGNLDSISSGQKCYLSRRILPDGSLSDPVKLGASTTRRSTIDFVNENFGRATYDYDGNPRGWIELQGHNTWQDIELYSFSFGGERQLENAVFDANFNFSRAEKSYYQLDAELQRQGFAFEYDRSDRFGSYDSQYPIINGLDPNEVVTDPSRIDALYISSDTVEFRDNEEDRFQFDVNYERDITRLEQYSFISGTWKVGGKWRSMERSFDYTEFDGDLPTPGEAGYEQVPWASFVRENPYGEVQAQVMPVTLDPVAFYDWMYANDGGLSSIRLDTDVSQEQDYTAKETVFALYAMVSLQAGPVEVVGGVRGELTNFEAIRQLENPADVFTTVSNENEYENILPSIHVKYEVFDDFLLRLSAGKTFSRPQIANLVDIRRVNEDDDPVEIDQGNPELATLTSTNFDVAAEWYLADGFYSVGWFDKDMYGFDFDAQTIIPGTLDNEFGGRDIAINQPQSTARARNRGFEVAAFQRFSFLPGALAGLYTNASFTYTLTQAEYPNRIENELPTRGASKFLGYFQVGYDYGRFNIAMSYRYRSPYIEGLAFVDAQGENTFVEDDMFGEQEIFDLVSTFRVTDSIDVFANITNMFDEIHASRQGYLDTPEDVYYNERRIAIGIKGSF